MDPYQQYQQYDPQYDPYQVQDYYNVEYVDYNDAEALQENQTDEYDEDLEAEVNLCAESGNFYDRRERDEFSDTGQGAMIMIDSDQAADAMCVKPWIGAIKEPSNAPRTSSQPPQKNLQLEYVYGYRCFDTRQNVYYTQDPNSIVYMVAAIGIVLNKQTNTQQFYGAGPARTTKEHDDDITCLAISKNRSIVATGQVGANPKVCVWSPNQPSQPAIQKFQIGRGRRACSAIGISVDQRLVAVADLHNDHYISVWDISSGSKVAEDKGGVDKILDLCWAPQGHRFCSVGIKHIMFWEYRRGLTKKKGIFGRKGAMCNMTTVVYLPDGSTVTGGANGQLYHWVGNQLQRTVEAHGKGRAVHALNANQNYLVSGGKDNRVIVFNMQLRKVSEFNVGSCPRALDLNDFGQVLVGCRNGNIIEYSQQGQQLLMESHNDGEVWGLAVHPQMPNIIFTSGDDNQIKMWDLSTHRCVQTGTVEQRRGQQRRPGYGASTLATTTPNQQSRALAINPSGTHLAVAQNTGKVTIRDVQNLNSIISELNQPREWTQAMSYSPNGQFLAVGSHDNFIYIYNSSNYSLRSTCRGHSSFITGLDWSIDSHYLHSVCGAYELLFWSVDGTQQKSGATQLRDEPWATWTTILGWPVQGIQEGVIDYTHVNTVDRSKSQDVCAIGNDWGMVALFQYPNGKQATGKSYRAHSEHVTNVRWTNYDVFLISTGGYDQAVMQWASGWQQLSSQMDDFLILAIADLHGNKDLLDEALIQGERLAQGKELVVVTVGDYMDNGLQVKELMDRVIELKHQMGDRYLPIAGNHDVVVSLVVDSNSFNARERIGKSWWQQWSSVYWSLIPQENTAAQYSNGELNEELFRKSYPQEHLQFIQELPWYQEVGNYIFVHAGLYFNDRMTVQDQLRYLDRKDLSDLQPGWLPDQLRNRQLSELNDPDWGKIVVSGHQKFRDQKNVVGSHRLCFHSGTDQRHNLHCALLVPDAENLITNPPLEFEIDYKILN